MSTLASAKFTALIKIPLRQLQEKLETFLNFLKITFNTSPSTGIYKILLFF